MVKSDDALQEFTLADAIYDELDNAISEYGSVQGDLRDDAEKFATTQVRIDNALENLETLERQYELTDEQQQQINALKEALSDFGRTGDRTADLAALNKLREKGAALKSASENGVSFWDGFKSKFVDNSKEVKDSDITTAMQNIDADDLAAALGGLDGVELKDLNSLDNRGLGGNGPSRQIS